MSNYVPDRWVLIESNIDFKKRHMIVAEWTTLSVESWRYSSTIKSVLDLKDRWEVRTASDALYILSKTKIGVSPKIRDKVNYAGRVFIDTYMSVDRTLALIS